MIDLNKKIGIICRTETEWIECQEVLFKFNFTWSRANVLNLSDIIYDTLPLLIVINSKNLSTSCYLNKKLLYSQNLSQNFPLYECKLFLRKLKLEKLYEKERFNL